jgi:hypothetical protein
VHRVDVDVSLVRDVADVLRPLCDVAFQISRLCPGVPASCYPRLRSNFLAPSGITETGDGECKTAPRERRQGSGATAPS